MYSMIQTGAQFGMLTLDQCLLDLVRRNTISHLEARTYASSRKHSSAKEPLMDRDQATRFIHDLLKLLLSKKGSDLFLTAEFPPAFKVDGRVTPVSNQPLMAQHTAELVRAIMNDRQAAEFESSRECNFAISPTGIGRFRVSAFVQQGKVGIVFRVIADKNPDRRGAEPADDRQRPGDGQARHRDDGRRHRLRQVDHAGGDGRLPQREQPGSHHHHRGPGRVRPPAPELHRPHRDIGVDCESWQVALKNTLRQAPDVILIGEVRERETMSTRSPSPRPATW